MAREIRTIKRKAYSDEKLCMVPRAVRWTFFGLITNADDHGRLRADTRLLKAAIYPLDDDVTPEIIRQEVLSLEYWGFVRRYEVKGTQYLELVNFEKHQKMARKYGSDIPAPTDGYVKSFADPADEYDEEADAVCTQCVGSADAVCTHIRRGEEIGEGAEKERSGDAASLVVFAPAEELNGGSRSSDDEPPAPAELTGLLERLPRNAQQFMAMFYEPAMTPRARERYRNVLSQVFETLPSNHPGPKIRGGQRVKARSVEHLDDTAGAVIRNPPMNRDAAIVLLLQKLLDPPKGPSVTEVAKQTEARERSLEEQWRRETMRATKEWAAMNPEIYEPIRLEVDARYAGKSGGFVQETRATELMQKCAKAMGLPTFNAWLKARTGAA